jgi:hypothetical protein
MEEQQGMAAAEQPGMAETDRWSRGVCFGGGANPRRPKWHEVTLYPLLPMCQATNSFSRHRSERTSPPKPFPAGAGADQIDDFRAAWAPPSTPTHASAAPSLA